MIQSIQQVNRHLENYEANLREIVKDKNIEYNKIGRNNLKGAQKVNLEEKAKKMDNLKSTMQNQNGRNEKEKSSCEINGDFISSTMLKKESDFAVKKQSSGKILEKVIKDKKKETFINQEFIKDIQDTKSKESLNKKYKMSGATVNKKIEYILGDFGVKNYTGAKEYLKNINVEEIVKEIEIESKNAKVSIKQNEILETPSENLAPDIKKKYARITKGELNKRKLEVSEYFKSLGENKIVDTDLIKKNNDKEIEYTEKSDLYNALMLYKDIKQELERIIPLIGFYYSKILDDTLSLLLGQAASHISKKHYSRTEIAEDLLNGYEISLKSKFSLWKKETIDNIHQLLLIKAEDKISKFIQKYRIYNQIYFGNDFIFTVNSLKRYTHGKSSYEHHPNLKVNYFEKIDSKEKAYWLGWLFAEAWLSQHPQQKNSYEIGVGCKVDDIRLLYKFANAIGFNIKFKQIKNYIDDNNNEKGFISIRFLNKEFAYWLQSRGFIAGSSKSGNISLPKLNSRELYLSFLLGFFDGDGIQGSSEIRCGSRKFFEQIKDLFSIHNLITEKTSKRINFNGRIIKGKTYGLFLGADLFNEMLDNYQTSLPRKRIFFTGKQERLEQLSRARDVAKKFRISPNEFEILLWLMPMKDIAELLDISYGRVCKYKKRWENEGLIKIPPYGYWNRKVTLRIYLINNILSNYDINSPYYNNYK